MVEFINTSEMLRAAKNNWSIGKLCGLFFPSILFICQIKLGTQSSPASFGNGAFKKGFRCSPERRGVDLQSEAVGAEDTMS